MDRVKIGYRISREAHTKLKIAAAKSYMPQERYLDWLLMTSNLPVVEINQDEVVERGSRGVYNIVKNKY